MSSILNRQLMSLYVTLLLSVACLGYAELGQATPETPYIYCFMFLALGAAFYLEGKFTLSIMLSNALATVMLAFSIFWLVSRSKSPDTLSYEADLNLLRSLVAHSGPILCSLLLAKLFRPKTPSDQWLLQLLGLVQVLLASVLAMSTRLDRDAPLFPVLMITYLASLAWAFRLFYLRREAEQLHQLHDPLSQIHWFSLRPVGWFLVCLISTITIFFCLPQGGLDASLLRGDENVETGATSSIDLNAEGTVQISDEQVMQISARNAKGQRVEMPDSLRLRGTVLSVYNDKSGVWLPFPASSFYAQQLPSTPQAKLSEDCIRMEYDLYVAQLQELGRPRASRYSTDISVPLFLADPPISSGFHRKYFSSPAMGRIPTPMNANVFEGQYWLSLPKNTRTVTLTHDYAGKLNATEWEQRLLDSPGEYNTYRQALEKVPTKVKESGRIAKLAEEVLSKANLTARSPARTRAKALEKFLSDATFAYSLERRRQDTNIDPTEDFLFNVKEGHCERFASALTIMLRSQGIPARIVIGYRGLEWNDIGNYWIVRQYHAHAWVEALIDESILEDGRRVCNWMVLDAAPVRDAASAENGYSATISFARFLWEFFILDFAGQAQRARLMAQLQHTFVGKFITWWNTLNAWQALAVVIPCLLVSVGIVWGLLVLRNRWRMKKYGLLTSSPKSVPFFEQLIQLLSRKGIKPAAYETAQEFATGARKQLLQKKMTAEVSGLPNELIPPYYAVRYGGAELPGAQLQQVDDQLHILRTALSR